VRDHRLCNITEFRTGLKVEKLRRNSIIDKDMARVHLPPALVKAKPRRHKWGPNWDTTTRWGEFRVVKQSFSLYFVSRSVVNFSLFTSRLLSSDPGSVYTRNPYAFPIKETFNFAFESTRIIPSSTVPFFSASFTLGSHQSNYQPRPCPFRSIFSHCLLPLLSDVRCQPTTSEFLQVFHVTTQHSGFCTSSRPTAAWLAPNKTRAQSQFNVNDVHGATHLVISNQNVRSSWSYSG
jgi:hypothetical protein